MRCIYCNKVFYIKRDLLNLFNTNKEYICNGCYKKYPINLRYEAVMLDKYSCVIISMFNRKYNIDYNGYYKEYSKVFNSLLNKKDYFPLFIDFLNLEYETLETLDCYSKLVKKNLIILCFNLKRD